jgi:hypothetical protein
VCVCFEAFSLSGYMRICMYAVPTYIHNTYIHVHRRVHSTYTCTQYSHTYIHICTGIRRRCLHMYTILTYMCIHIRKKTALTYITNTYIHMYTHPQKKQYLYTYTILTYIHIYVYTYIQLPSLAQKSQHPLNQPENPPHNPLKVTKGPPRPQVTHYYQTQIHSHRVQHRLRNRQIQPIHYFRMHMHMRL